MKNARIYIVVVNWNGREHLAACLESLLASDGVGFHVVLVDNASSDGSVEFVRARFGDHPALEVVELDRNRGWSGGNNVGIRMALEAGAAYIFLLNNDTAIAPDALAILAARMDAEPALGALAPRMVLYDTPGVLNSVGLEMSIAGAAWDRGVGRLDGPAWWDDRPLIGACGGACLLRAEAVRAAGLLPEDFEIYLDDLDLCIRILRSGYTIRPCPEAVVRHKFSATMGEGGRARRKYFLNTRNRFRILLRHAPLRMLPRVVAAVAMGEVRAIGRAALEGAWWRIGSHLCAWLALPAMAREALRFRRGFAGTAPFWHLVRPSPLFCPAVTLPEKGWYPPVAIEGGSWRPMADEATIEVPPGPLKVRVLNCYPAIQSARVTLQLNGHPLGEVFASPEGTWDGLVDGGCLHLSAGQCFQRDQTGLHHDTGAWVEITWGEGVPSATTETEIANVL